MYTAQITYIESYMHIHIHYLCTYEYIFTMRNNVLKIDQASWDIRDTEYIRLHTLMATSAIITMEW